MALKTYDAKDCAVIVAGTALSGFAGDAVVNIIRNSENYSSFTGADREDTTRARNADQSANVEISLAQSSGSNAYLYNFIKLDRQDNSGTFDLSINTPDGQFSGVDCYIIQDPDATYTAEATNDRVYTVYIPKLEGGLSGQ